MHTAKNKFLYVNEFELVATVKQVFPFLATPMGLEAWFADKVEITHRKKFFNLLGLYFASNQAISTTEK